MSDPFIAFLPQPVQTLAREGEAAAQVVIDTLQEWVASEHRRHVVEKLGEQTYVLSVEIPRRPILNMVVIARGSGGTESADVCLLGSDSSKLLLVQAKRLASVERLATIMQVRLNAIESGMFEAVAASYLTSTIRFPRTHEGTRSSDADDWLRTFETLAHRWASSKARNSFKTLLDDAKFRPQLVERGNDDLFVVSRRYLRETVKPTTARALSRRYRGLGLSDADMPHPWRRTLAPLEDLPDLGPR